MSRGFVLEKVGRFRRSAGRGMARAGFSAVVIAVVLGLKRETAQALVDSRDAPGALWSTAEMALFRKGR
ncbi:MULTISPECIES: hypothetical protein [unclassified Bosea (in: a-proteobacteria)]|uniref:hypothetical protein n=1 Tax=unclassified Bosea (in: a-proteobacteria) TaxID=2653178 RepID=UPI000F76040F|nr:MULTISPECIES: hypothetical protein [unclassified Bosea (in: a-proteobacteria)]AZO77738.1 hypothetical protein BLM15_08990 [Bosea sp. Tri-49]RXT18352.1 hypothetical protein B5U98_24145 [Bosea sp. Tri-39]RXT32948.1 hypothetical protein B5U99_30490 [Bosea sp. Tri-54]